MGSRLDQTVLLIARRELSPSSFSLELSCSQPFKAEPGQFAMLGLSAGYDPLLRRPFSIATVKQEDKQGIKVELLIKEVGKTTRALRRLPLGATLHLLAPLGKGFQLAAAGAYPALVAGGIGLPPLLFAASALRQRGVHFDFFFGAANHQELFLREEIAKLTSGEVIFTTDDGSFGEPGPVTQALERRLDRGYTRILACGPTPMLKALARLARAWEVEAEVSMEEPMACGVGVCLGCVVKLKTGTYVASCKDGPVFLTSQLAEDW